MTSAAGYHPPGYAPEAQSFLASQPQLYSQPQTQQQMYARPMQTQPQMYSQPQTQQQIPQAYSQPMQMYSQPQTQQQMYSQPMQTQQQMYSQPMQTQPQMYSGPMQTQQQMFQPMPTQQSVYGQAMHGHGTHGPYSHQNYAGNHVAGGDMGETQARESYPNSGYVPPQGYQSGYQAPNYNSTPKTQGYMPYSTNSTYPTDCAPVEGQARAPPEPAVMHQQLLANPEITAKKEEEAVQAPVKHAKHQSYNNAFHSIPKPESKQEHFAKHIMDPIPQQPAQHSQHVDAKKPNDTLLGDHVTQNGAKKTAAHAGNPTKPKKFGCC